MAKGYSTVSTFSPEQQSLFQQLMQSLQGAQGNISQNPLYKGGTNYLQNLFSGSPEAFSAFEAPYLRQFNEQTVPALAERFTGLGARNSSAFQQALGQAGSGLSESLASLRSGLQMQALPQALGYAQQPFSNIFGTLGLNTQAFMPKQLPWWQQLLLGLGGGAGQGLGQIGGSLAGAALF